MNCVCHHVLESHQFCMLQKQTGTSFRVVYEEFYIALICPVPSKGSEVPRHTRKCISRGRRFPKRGTNAQVWQLLTLDERPTEEGKCFTHSANIYWAPLLQVGTGQSLAFWESQKSITDTGLKVTRLWCSLSEVTSPFSPCSEQWEHSEQRTHDLRERGRTISMFLTVLFCLA